MIEFIEGEGPEDLDPWCTECGRDIDCYLEIRPTTAIASSFCFPAVLIHCLRLFWSGEEWNGWGGPHCLLYKHRVPPRMSTPIRLNTDAHSYRLLKAA